MLKCCSDASGWVSLEHSLGQKPACIQLRGVCDPRGAEMQAWGWETDRRGGRRRTREPDVHPQGRPALSPARSLWAVSGQETQSCLQRDRDEREEAARHPCRSPGSQVTSTGLGSSHSGWAAWGQGVPVGRDERRSRWTGGRLLTPVSQQAWHWAPRQRLQWEVGLRMWRGERKRPIREYRQNQTNCLAQGWTCHRLF